MGTFIDDRDGAMYFQHGAGNDGFCGQFYASLDEGYGVVIFLNSEDPKLIYEVMNSVAKVYNWKNYYREPLRKKSIPVSDKVLKRYEGIYLFDNNWAGVGKKDKKYHFYTSFIYANMYFTSPLSFFNEEFSAVKEFIKDEKGNVTGYTRTVEGKAFPNATKVTNPEELNLANQLFGDIGWYLFETKKYKESLAYFKRGAQLYPEDLNMAINMAHLYLFNKDYKSALAIYKAHIKEDIRPGYSWVSLMKDDRTYFKDHHYDVKLFDKVFKALNIQP